MFRIHLNGPRHCASKLFSTAQLFYLKFKLLILTLFYNDHCDYFYAAETCMTPAFWFIDNYIRHLGPFFVCLLTFLIGAVVIIAYLIVLPFEFYRKSLLEIFFYLIIGNWILINVVFHYAMALTISPGYPPKDILLLETVGICKSCLLPKPPRTHHCRICNRCILQMDHHCPWLNQCVGHFNRRYFFCTLAFIWMGSLLVVILMASSFSEHLWTGISMSVLWCDLLQDRLFYAPLFCANTDSAWNITWDSGWSDTDFDSRSLSFSSPFLRNLILFELFLCFVVVIGIGILLFWHSLLVTRGETTIEQHINRKMMREEGLAFKNTYDFGPARNWRIFLGLEKVNKRTFWRHVLLPSKHLPDGDGIIWKNATYGLERMEI